MKKLIRNPLAIALGLLVLFALWFAFRPELLFVNKGVDEPFPSPAATHAFVLPSNAAHARLRLAVIV